MPEFIVRVGTPDGAITERHVQAISVRAAVDELRQQDMHVFDARRGTVQLRDAAWNQSGYLHNSWQFVEVEVTA